MNSLQPFIMFCLLFSASMGFQQQSGNSAEAESIAKIISLGGSVEHEGKDPLRLVVRIYLHRTSVNDTDLEFSVYDALTTRAGGEAIDSTQAP